MISIFSWSFKKSYSHPPIPGISSFMRSKLGSFNQAFGLVTAVLSFVPGGLAKTLGILSCGGIPNLI